MTDLSIGQFVALLGGMAAKLPMVEHHALERAAEIVEKEAKDLIGEEHPFWPPLAESTLAHKAANTPLLETGEMRDSIEHKVEGPVAYVGSNSDIAVYQELGTAKIPPRSFLAQGAIRKEKEVVELIGRSVHSHLIGRSVTDQSFNEH